jgi:EAL domain-containing protein (putative c-di-GMP-specific phosphodiesterase class I)
MVGSRKCCRVEATMALARDLSLTCVVTDVQNAKQLSFLKEIKAEQCQGTLFNASMPAAEFASRWLVQTA